MPRRRCTATLLLITAAVSAQSAHAAEGAKYALLVGVRNYSEEKVLHPLSYAEPDVTELAQVFRDSGLRPENVVLMTQAAAAEEPRFLPEKRRILKELRLLLAGRSEADTVLVAFAGHGVHFKDDKNSYFCPSDAQLDDRSTLISLADVYAELEKCRAGVKVLLVDACRNDPFADKSRAARVDLESVTRPQLPDPPKGVVAFFSCSEKEKAYEADKLKHGVFFHYVIEGLKGEAAPDKEDVSLLDLGAYVTGHVADFVRAEYGQVQQPELVGRSSGSAALLRIDRSGILLRRGQAHMDAQEYDKAVEDFTAALRINPKSVDALTERARAHDARQAYDQVEADCTEALRIDARCVGAYFWRAESYGKRQQFANAIADYDQAIRLDPSSAWQFNNRGWWRLQSGDHAKAAADFSEAIRLDATPSLFRLNRGDAYEAGGEHEKAIADYGEAIRLEPNNLQAYLNRGLAYDALADHDHAIADYGEAIRLDPKHAWAYNDRGCAYRDKGDADKAIDDFTEAIRLDPQTANFYINRAAVYDNSKADYAAAVADATEAIKLEPRSTGGYFERGLAYLRWLKPDRSVADFDEVIRLDARDAWAFNNRGCAYRDKDDLDAAVADMTEAIRLNPKEPTYYENRAGVYDMLNDPDKADADRARAKRLRGE